MNGEKVVTEASSAIVQISNNCLKLEIGQLNETVKYELRDTIPTLRPTLQYQVSLILFPL